MNSAFCSSSADLQKNGGSRNNLQSTGTLADESEKDKHEWTTMTPQQVTVNKLQNRTIILNYYLFSDIILDR